MENNIKVINLLNKIANGEEVPKKIHIRQFQCDFIFNGHTYLSDEKEPQNIYWCLHSEALNYEVEIIEEDKEIEHYDMFDNFTGFGFGGTDKELLSDLQRNFEHINEELDYLIKAVNELKKGK